MLPLKRAQKTAGEKEWGCKVQEGGLFQTRWHTKGRKWAREKGRVDPRFGGGGSINQGGNGS